MRMVMDKEMREIAIYAVARCSGGHGDCIVAACKAVLAEQKRRDKAAAQEPQCLCAGPDAPHATHGTSAQTPAPDGDVVERMLEAYELNNGTILEQLAAALAVAEPIITARAREGWLPQSRLEEMRDNARCLGNDLISNARRVKELEQKLASMVTREQVDKALKDEWESCQGSHSYTQHRRDVIARLTQQGPTVQEPQVPIDNTNEWEAQQVVPLGLVAKTVQQVFHDGYGTGSVCVDEIIKRLTQQGSGRNSRSRRASD